jgi:hypothetical protein
MGVMAKSRTQKYNKILDIKGKTTVEELCRGFPHEFMDYFKEVRSLRFTDEPNYSSFRKAFRDLFLRQGYIYDYQYDWCSNIAAMSPLAGLTPKVVGETQKMIPPFTAMADPGETRLRLKRLGKGCDEARPPFTASPGIMLENVPASGGITVPAGAFVTPRLRPKGMDYGRKARIDAGTKRTMIPRWVSTRGLGFVTR